MTVTVCSKSTSGSSTTPSNRPNTSKLTWPKSWVHLTASFALPVIVIAAGHTDWVLPSIAITIGTLPLWLDHRVDIPRYRPVGWALIIGPVLLVATMSGAPLAATTGIAAGVLLLTTAFAGFHDLAGVRPLG